MNGVTAERLVAFAKQRFEGRWQKRVAEDLVEVLGGMKVNVGTKVDLQLEELASKKRVERRDVDRPQPLNRSTDATGNVKVRCDLRVQWNVRGRRLRACCA